MLRQPRVRDERGATAVLFSVCMTVLFGMAALVIDVGALYVVDSELQTSADAAALAGASMLPDEDAAIARARQIALANHDGLDAGSVSVEVGYWSVSASTFTPDASPVNAVRVRTFRAADTGNPVEHNLAGVLGRDEADVDASAVALLDYTTLDFTGFNPGDIPNEVSHGQGISGAYISGHVEVSATSNRNNSSRCPVVDGERRCAMIFDGTCSGGCSGGDSDLEFPSHGNILIITEDGDQSDPDDEARGGTFHFDFTNLGSGTVSVRSLGVLDIDPGDDILVTLYGSEGEVLDQTYLAGAGDGVAVDRFVSGVSGVARMDVELQGSGAIDDIAYLRVVKVVE